MYMIQLPWRLSARKAFLVNINTNILMLIIRIFHILCVFRSLNPFFSCKVITLCIVVNILEDFFNVINESSKGLLFVEKSLFQCYFH